MIMKFADKDTTMTMTIEVADFCAIQDAIVCVNEGEIPHWCDDSREIQVILHEGEVVVLLVTQGPELFIGSAMADTMARLAG